MTSTTCPQCEATIHDGLCHCPGNRWRCDDCGGGAIDYRDGTEVCKCKVYALIHHTDVEAYRRLLADPESFWGPIGVRWDSLDLTVERVGLAKALGCPRVADEINAQVRAYGFPGPRRKLTQPEIDELGASGDTVPDLAMSQIDADIEQAHRVLEKSRFGDCRWTDETWTYIDKLLGADNELVARCDARRKASQTPWIMRMDSDGDYETYESFVNKIAKRNV